MQNRNFFSFKISVIAVESMYAEDIASIADSVRHLQKQIDILKIFCNLYGIRVNLEDEVW